MSDIYWKLFFTTLPLLLGGLLAWRSPRQRLRCFVISTLAGFGVLSLWSLLPAVRQILTLDPIYHHVRPFDDLVLGIIHSSLVIIGVMSIFYWWLWRAWNRRGRQQPARRAASER
jgi:uncharacterized BrkB/YihY/UPF0761 family membrane protein